MSMQTRRKPTSVDVLYFKHIENFAFVDVERRKRERIAADACFGTGGESIGRKQSIDESKFV